MLDIYLAGFLFGAIEYGKRIVLIGDADQLSSVGPGAVLSEIIASGRIPVVRLDKVFRQDSVSQRMQKGSAMGMRHWNTGMIFNSSHPPICRYRLRKPVLACSFLWRARTLRRMHPMSWVWQKMAQKIKRRSPPDRTRRSRLSSKRRNTRRCLRLPRS